MEEFWGLRLKEKFKEKERDNGEKWLKKLKTEGFLHWA